MVGRLYNPSMYELANRLATFAPWPIHVAVKPKDLAEAGFYYVGPEDRVCCFSCGGTLNGWQEGDNPEERHLRYFGSRCEFIRYMLGVGSSPWMQNMPLPQTTGFDPLDTDMENEAQRLRSFQRNNGWRGAVDPRRLAAAGFYYTGIDDNVQCFACNEVLKAWVAQDDPIKEHVRSRPDCPFISRKANISHSYIGSGGSSFQVNFGQNFRPNVVMNYHPPVAATTPVSAPKPNYSSEHARLHTFINWPKTCPVQPKELIDAGFYYTGIGDKVECFKCGIILAGWEPLDTPWGEHAKWSKNCPLVVDHFQRRNPHSPAHAPRTLVFPQEQSIYKDIPCTNFPTTSRPSPSKAATLSVENNIDELKAVSVVKLPSEQSECSGTGGFAKVSVTVKGDDKNEIFYLHKAVQRLVESGEFDLATINEAVQHRTKVEGGSINSMAELRNTVASFTEMSSISEKPACPTGQTKLCNPESGDVDLASNTLSSSSMSDRFSSSIDQQALQRHVQKMQEAHRCKICLDAEIGMVFLPCGHLVCCPKCGAEIQSKSPAVCPICRRTIDSTIRTYLT